MYSCIFRFSHSAWLFRDSSSLLYIKSSFLLLLSSIPLNGYASLFIHLPVDTGLFPVWGYYRNGRRAVNAGADTSVWTRALISLGWTPSSRTARLCGELHKPFQETANCSSKWWYHFSFLQLGYNSSSSCSCTFLPAPGMVSSYSKYMWNVTQLWIWFARP